MEDELLEAIERVVRSGQYIQGEENSMFATELSALTGVRHCVPVSNGLDALRLIFRAYIELGDLKKGDEVIAPATTYIASILPLAELGFKTVLVKPDLKTFGLDWQEVKKAVTPATKAVLTVHLYGNPSWDFEIAQWLEDKGIKIIEDNAQAIGATVINPETGQLVYTGALGDASAFSFYPTKNIGALGDAGAICTDNAKLAKTAKALANYGSSMRYHNDFIGYNCRMDEIQAAILRVKLNHIEALANQRKEAALLYDKGISNPYVAKPFINHENNQVWHQYVIMSTERDQLREFLESNGISTDIHYPLPLHRQECFKDFDTDRLELFGDASRVADKLSSEILSLPIANVTPQDIKEITNTINKFSPAEIYDKKE